MSTRNDAIQRCVRKIMDVGSGSDGSGNVLLNDTFAGEEVDAAVIQYSVDSPRERIIDLTGLTSPYIPITSLTGWVDHFSEVLALDYPAGTVSATYQPTWASFGEDPENIQTYRDGSATYLYLPQITPAASEKLRFYYTAMHTLNATSSDDSIPTFHFDAVCDLAAAFCCRRLATLFAKESEPTLAADSVNYRDGQLRMKQQADAFEAQYRRKIGITEKGPEPVTATADWDASGSLRQDRLWHSRRFR